MDQIKEAFKKIKYDIDYLKENLTYLIKGFEYTQSNFNQIKKQQDQFNKTIDIQQDILQNQHQLQQKIQQTLQKLVEIQEKQQELLETTPKTNIQTHNPENKTDSTHSSTHNTSFKPLNDQNLSISIGNGGVQTDRQTNRQTDKSTQINTTIQKNSVDNALEILESLDNIKKEIRLKFKRLTDQEWLIFSTIYQLDEEQGYSDYKTLADTLKLTESSIRDYIGRLIKKGIPIEKNKINNKTIQLNISSNLKKIASLPTIIQLRGL